MKMRKTAAALSLIVLLPITAACAAESTTASSTGTTATTTTQSAPDARGGPGAEVGSASVATEADLVALVQSAYGDAGLGLHRGHQPVQDVLDEVLTISHDELHVRMEEQNQNLAAIAEDLGIDPQTLVAALVESWRHAVAALLGDGTLPPAQADGCLGALEEAFTFRVSWDGQEATPTFAGLDA